jgi:hypothetical protein
VTKTRKDEGYLINPIIIFGSKGVGNASWIPKYFFFKGIGANTNIFYVINEKTLVTQRRILAAHKCVGHTV